MILYIENPKDATKSFRTNKHIEQGCTMQNHKNESHSYIIRMNGTKSKLAKKILSSIVDL